MYTQHKIVVGFIIYKPENSFIERLKKTVVDGFKIYIFDNSPEESNVRDFCLGRKEIKYLTVGKNVGLGLGISSICAQAYYEGNSALVFFDQDTVFQSETLSFIDNYHMNHEILEATYSAVVFGASNSLIAGGADCFQDVNVAINSGSLFFLRNLKNIGWHNETYFVDGVDYEFCLNSKKHGLKIGKFMCTPGFDHSIEQADRKYRIFQKTFILRAYPLFRVLDTLKSSCKLLLSALLSLEFRFAAMILKFASVFMVVQLLSRFLKPVK
jgi:rhamnosyltransferase